MHHARDVIGHRGDDVPAKLGILVFSQDVQHAVVKVLEPLSVDFEVVVVDPESLVYRAFLADLVVAQREHRIS